MYIELNSSLKIDNILKDIAGYDLRDLASGTESEERDYIGGVHR